MLVPFGRLRQEDHLNSGVPRTASGGGGGVPNQTKKDLSGKESITVFCIWKGRDSGDGTQVLMHANKFFVPIPSYGLLNQWF